MDPKVFINVGCFDDLGGIDIAVDLSQFTEKVIGAALVLTEEVFERVGKSE